MGQIGRKSCEPQNRRVILDKSPARLFVRQGNREMMLRAQKISSFLIAAIFASSIFGLAELRAGSVGGGVSLGPLVGASNTQQMVVGQCGKECENGVSRERSNDIGSNGPSFSDSFGSSHTWPSLACSPGFVVRGTSVAAFVSTVRIQV
jgi:hypothetical protein